VAYFVSRRPIQQKRLFATFRGPPVEVKSQRPRALPIALPQVRAMASRKQTSAKLVFRGSLSWQSLSVATAPGQP
jgi:hypothetical protein